jgi:hypothetical protein
MRRVLFLLLAVTALAAERKPPTRAVLREAETRFDSMIQKQWTYDPYVLLGNSRAIYVEGFGVVMTAEINLVTGPTVSPFNPTISKEAATRHRERKLQRLPQLRQLVKSGADTARVWFPELPDGDNLIIGITLLKYAWEDGTGIPSQVVAVTQKRKDAAVKLQEN